MISLDEFYRALKGFRPLPDAAQRAAIEAPASAGLFIVAGPGSGKTTCLTLRMLKLMMVDNVPPRGILATTFTVKAAEELRSRLLGWGFQLVDGLKADVKVSAENKTWLGDMDINQVWTGTLDSLCEQLLRDYRAPGTHPPVLADEFVGRTLLLRAGLLNDSRHKDVALDLFLLDLYGGGRFGFHVGAKAGLLQSMWDRRFQDLVDWSDFQANGPIAQKAARGVLATALDAYEKELSERHMVDFALLEYEVLKRLRNGQLSEFTQDLRVVLVDEYQDTNLLQEQIYFQFAKACGGAVGVVGDDDQSLYRFRGATVNLFRNFEARYETVFAARPLAVYLSTNYRSTQKIVAFVNHFAELDAGYQCVRVVGKPRLMHGPQADTGRPVLGMFRPTLDDLADDLAGFIHSVFRGSGFVVKGVDKIIRDPKGGDVGDCALLCSSPAEFNGSGKPRLPLKLRQALAALDPPIEVFNPRGEDLSKVRLVEIFGGLLAECIDPGGAIQSSQVFLPQDAHDALNRWRQSAVDFVESAEAPAGLLDYAKAWAMRDPVRTGYEWPRRIPVIELVYGLVHYLAALHDDPEGQVYLEAFTRQLGACEQVSGFKGALLHDPNNRELSDKSIRDLVRDFLGPIASEMVQIDEELIGSFPRSRLSLLSIHQSKGLEFPLTIVDVSSDFSRNHPANAFKRFPKDGGPAHRMEDAMRPHSPELGKEARTQTDRAFDDLIRQYFVAYSRPQEVLLLVGLGMGGPSGNIPNVATGWRRDGVPRWADPRSLPLFMI
jgi:DNA helicase-2/ATP-dependent DNA helicase PcrA